MESWRHTSEGRSPFLCGEIGIENMEFRELGFHDMTRKSDPDNPSLGVSIGEIGNCFSGTLPSSTCDITSISSFEELESGLSFSSPFIVPNGRKSSPLDLKWGKLADWREAKNSRFSNGTLVISSVGSSMASKRARIVNLYSQNPICQVQGCNKDLSSSKDYHKRHKVCDVHSKTSMVVVNGIEQRFCQQCSRFHLLAEFDDGKRSCRKRLAGHNERRRKPQLDTLSGKSHNFLQYYEGARFLRTSLSKRTSFVFPDMLPTGNFISSQGNVRDSNCSHIKVEEESNSRPVFHLNGIGNLFPPGDFPLQAGYTFLETTSKVQELSGVSNSSSALSLLSAQSKNMSSHLTETPLGFHQNSEKYVGVSFEEKALPNGFCSSGLNSMGIGQVGSPVDFCGSGAAIDGSEVQATGILQRSNSVKFKDEPTVDLIQLSSHLERVEQQRNSMQVKQENDVFFYFPSM